MPDITLPADDLIQEILLDQSHRSISMLMGQIVYGHFKNKHSYYVQFEYCSNWRAENPQFSILDRPMLWKWQAWIESDIRNSNIKAYEHKRRVKQWIAEENIMRVKPFVKSFLNLDEVAAFAIASQLVHKEEWRKIKALGCMKIITKEEEL